MGWDIVAYGGVLVPVKEFLDALPLTHQQSREWLTSFRSALEDSELLHEEFGETLDLRDDMTKAEFFDCLLSAMVKRIESYDGELCYFTEFAEWLNRVLNPRTLYGVIDRKGQFVGEPQFEDAQSFQEGTAAVLLDGKWGFISENENLVIDLQYE